MTQYQCFVARENGSVAFLRLHRRDSCTTVLQRERRGEVLWLDLFPDGTTHCARQIVRFLDSTSVLGRCQPLATNQLCFPSFLHTDLKNVCVSRCGAFLCVSFCRSYRIVQVLHPCFDGAHFFESQYWHLERVVHLPAIRPFGRAPVRF